MSDTMVTGRTLATRYPDLRGRHVLVLGLGKSGLAATRLARREGARVTVADAKSAEQLGAARLRAREIGARVHAGGHPASLLAGVDLVVVSPGVPGDIAPLAAAREQAIPVWGEIELAARYCRGRVIGITGSNGKSTVTAMTGGILRAAGIGGGTGGNLDTPFCDLLEHDTEDAVHAVELSSFQLETVESFLPDVAVILNLSPDHLDRYPDIEAYADAKARILEVQTADDAAILNADDAPSDRFRSAVRGRLHLFSTEREVERGAFVRQGKIVVRTDAGEAELLDAEELPIPGVHNLSNALAAALACSLVGCPAEAIRSGIRDYRALPHRLERVAMVDGVLFYNDSKATNPASTSRALSAFKPGTVHLILGGRDKGADWSELLPQVERSARQVLLVGEATSMLSDLLAGGPATVVECETVPEAVEVAHRAAKAGDVVLLSPGCASFDQYRNFSERGDDFRKAVVSLGKGRKGLA
jgi:UDP-N-acetylmuramoylalanine--D-glutamate ligase